MADAKSETRTLMYASGWQMTLVVLLSVFSSCLKSFEELTTLFARPNARFSLVHGAQADFA
jgi:hypothetical protein